LTDKQRHIFANKLSELPDMNKYSQGTESYAQFAVRIVEMLQDQNKFQELLPYLKKVGFNKNKLHVQVGCSGEHPCTCTEGLH
jgi:hypothetical protein